MQVQKSENYILLLDISYSFFRLYDKALLDMKIALVIIDIVSGTINSKINGTPKGVLSC